MTSDTWFDVCILLTKEKNKIWSAKLQRNSSKTKPLICVTYMVVLVCNWLHVQISNLPDCSTTGDVDLHVCVCMCICVATHTLDVSSAMLGWVIPGKTQWHKIISMALFPSSHSISPKHILTGTALALFDHSCPTLRFHQRTYIYIYIYICICSINNHLTGSSNAQKGQKWGSKYCTGINLLVSQLLHIKDVRGDCVSLS